MDLLSRARSDAKRITTNGNEWGQPVRFKAPGGTEVTINARANKIHVKLDGDGIPFNSKNASVTFSEQSLSQAGYDSIRSVQSKEVDMKNHRVSWTDSTGESFTYRISETFPDETIGLIVAILTDYSPS